MNVSQDEILFRADAAMYQAKKAGQNLICIFGYGKIKAILPIPDNSQRRFANFEAD
ncbi:MAG: hypothetical protein Q7T38_08345 [Gallionella sp.]|nr:hypothetical protein [Gallionella sp.]